MTNSRRSLFSRLAGRNPSEPEDSSVSPAVSNAQILSAIAELSSAVATGFGRAGSAITLLQDNLAVVKEQLTLIQGTLKGIAVSEADITTDVNAISAVLTAVQGVLTDVATQAGTLVTDVTALQATIAAGGTVDTSALDALVTTAQALQTQATSAQSSLDPAVASVTTLATPAPAPSAAPAGG